MTEKFIIDRIEDTVAYCENEAGDIVEIARESLPEGASEGDVVISEDGVMRVDKDEAEERRKRIREKMKGLWK